MGEREPTRGADDDGGRAVGQDGLASRDGRVSVEHEIRGAGLQDSERGTHEARRPGQRQGDDGAAADAEIPQPVRDPVGRAVELSERQPRGLGLDGHGVRRTAGLIRAELVQQRTTRPRPPLALAESEYVRPPLEVEDRQPADRAGGLATARVEERNVGVDDLADGPRREEIGGQDRAPLDGSGSGLGLYEREVELGGDVVELDARGPLAGGASARGLQLEHDLEERIAGAAAPVAEALDQELEGHLLVGQVVGQRLPDGLHQARERRLERDVRPEDHRVHEEPAHALELGPRSTAHGHSDPEGRLPREPGEHRGEAGEQRGKERRPAGRGERAQASDEVHGQGEGHDLAALRLQSGRMVIAMELEIAEPREPLLPVGAQAVEPLASQVPPLPDREVGVLDAELAKDERPATETGTQTRVEVLDEDADGLPVRDDVVDDEAQQSSPVDEGAEVDACERGAGEIEGPPSAVAERGRELVSALRAVDDVEGDRSGVEDLLLRLAVLEEERRPQALVSGDEVVEGRLQRPGRHAAGHSVQKTMLYAVLAGERV